jgi:acetyl esterase/lipase
MSGELLLVVCLLGVLLPTLAAGAEETELERLEPETVELPTVYLWEGDAPGAEGEDEEDRPRLNVVAPSPERACGTAVIVCPGGGYNVRAMDWEGLQVARWLGELGVHAFILSYRVRNHGYGPAEAFVDGRRAVRRVRRHADEYGIDPGRIGAVGFSAGAHLVSRLTLEHDPGDADAGDPVERESSRPDFAMLIYCPNPGTRRGEEEEGPSPVNAATPPTFIMHTARDELLSPDPMLEHVRALREAGVETELHVFGGYGPHGIGMATGLPGAEEWPALAALWMRRSAFLTGKERVAVEGRITIDGKAPEMARITFIPVESDHDPIAAVRTGKPLGTFQLQAEHGPVTGRHRVEVRLVCRRFLTVPSQQDIVLYTKASPDAEGPLTLDLHPGTNAVNLDITTR